jgi:hypothetical protein
LQQNSDQKNFFSAQEIEFKEKLLENGNSVSVTTILAVAENFLHEKENFLIGKIDDACEKTWLRAEFERKRGFLKNPESRSFKSVWVQAMEILKEGEDLEGGAEGWESQLEERVRVKFEDGLPRFEDALAQDLRMNYGEMLPNGIEAMVCAKNQDKSVPTPDLDPNFEQKGHFPKASNQSIKRMTPMGSEKGLTHFSGSSLGQATRITKTGDVTPGGHGFGMNMTANFNTVIAEKRS